MELGSHTVRLFASAEAARLHAAPEPGVWRTTFLALMRAFAGPQVGPDGRVLRSIDLVATRLLLRSLRADIDLLPSEGTARFVEIRALSRGLAQLRAVGITAQHRQKFLKPSTSLVHLLDALQQYENALGRQALADTADVQRGALYRVTQGLWPGFLRHLHIVIVEPGVEVFDLRRDLLQVLAARGVHVTVRLPYHPHQPERTPWAEAMLHGFEAQGQGTVDFEFVPIGAQNDVGQIVRRLFDDAADAPTAIAAASDVAAPAVTFCSTAGHDHLITHVVRTVTSWLREGISADDIAVVLPPKGAMIGSLRAESLAPQLLHALGAAGAVCHTLSGLPLLEHEASRRLLDVLQLGHQFDTLPKPAGDELFSEAGLSVPVWAGLMQWSADAIVCGESELAGAAQANLMRRCGHRRLGPQGLRSALRALRGVSPEVADAVAVAAEAWVSRWLVPLGGGERPLTERLLKLVRLLEHVGSKAPIQPAAAAEPSAEDAHAQTVLRAIQEALRALCLSAQAIDIHTSLAEAAGWVGGALSEQRGPALHTGPAQGVSILMAEDLVGRRVSHVMALGLNNTPQSMMAGPLSEALRREINAALGYRLLQHGAVSGRAALPLGAQAQFYFYELLRATQNCFSGVVFRLADEEMSAPCADAALLMAAAGTPALALAPEPPPWHKEPAPTLALRGLLHANALEWARQEAPNDARLDLLAAGAQQLGEKNTAQHDPLHTATRQQLTAQILGTVQGVSSLDQLALCRYRYFAGPILGFSSDTHPEHHIDRRRAGEAAHRALFHVYTALLQARPWAHWQANTQAAHVFAEDTFAAKLTLILPLDWVHEDLRGGAAALVWHVVVTQLQRDLHNAGNEPRALEYRFGDPMRTGRPPLRIEHPTRPERSVLVRGTIDRVDVAGASLHVIDYKSSLPSREADRHLQLGLYQAVAHRDLVPKAQTITATWSLLGQPLSGSGQKKPAELSGDAPEVLRRTQSALWARLDGFLAGDTTPDPAPQSACRHCDFPKLCRYRPRTEQTLDPEGSQEENEA